MAEKMLDSTRAGMKRIRSSSNLPSIYGNESLHELVWENGQNLVHGGSSSATRNTPSCMRNDEDACITKSARLNTLHLLLDFPVQRDSSHRNPHQSNDQNSSQLDLQFSKTKNSIKLKDGSANLRPTTIENGYLCKKPRIDSSQTPVTNSQKQDLGKVNFSNLLRPSTFVKSTYKGNSATLHTNNKVLASVKQIKATKVGKIAEAATSSKAPDNSVVIDSSKGSHGFTGLKGQTPLISDTSNQVSFVARNQEPLPDEYSEALGHKNALRGSKPQVAKGKAVDTNSCNEPLLETSLCSLAASNNTNLRSEKHEDTDDSTYLSDNDEETEDVVKGTSFKRSRDAEFHNLNERKRRDKINKKMRVLKELIPNCNKVDKASMLDDAIKYLKTLKLQLQIMSMGTGLCMPPLMMLPTAAHHMINAPHLPQLMGAGMGFRPGTSIPSNLPQFPIPPLLGATDNRVGMFGFPDQVPPPMPMSHAPFIPMFGNPPTQPLLPTSTATNLAQLTPLNVSVPKNSYLNGQTQYATKQAPDQGTN